MVGLVTVLFGVGCADKPTVAQCEKLLTASVAIELRGRGVADGQLTERAAEVTEIARAEFMQQCQKTMPATRVRCGIQAKDRAALDACDEAEE